ncbi:MAG: pseudouridine synthase [Candidatus Peregrinibacteria bacterium]
MRINKFIASHTKYSRRKADELILSGKVSINNKITTSLGIQIDPDKDKVKIDSIPIQTSTKQVYIALNKPAGYATTRSDKFNKETVMDLVPSIPTLKPAGRLDKDTEGLIILSTDGEFINRLTHPKFECEKEYYAEIQGWLTPDKEQKLQQGIFIDNKKTSPAKIKILSFSPQKTALKISIREGRNRQIRKMFASLDHPVKYLKRLRVGKIELGSLKRGAFRHLTKKELHDFKLN